MMANGTKKIVIVGGGAGGLSLATRLAKSMERSQRSEITLIDENLTHIWKPSLHEFAAGTRGTEEEISFLEHSNRYGYNFRLGRFVGIDPQKKTALLDPVTDSDNEPLSPQRAIPYDILVVALGSRSNDFGCPGVQQNCLFLDTPRNANQLQTEILNLCLRLETGALETSSQNLRICVIGGGATGVELAAELREATEQLGRHGIDKLKIPQAVDISIVEASPRLVAALPEKISERVASKLVDLNIKLLLSSRVQAVTKASVKLQNGDTVGAELIVWTAGIVASSALKSIDHLEFGTLGRLKVKPSLQSLDDPSIFAIGDAAECQWAGTDTFLPPRAQVASQQAVFMVKQIKRIQAGQQLRDFQYVDRGSLVALSHSSAVGALMGKALGTFTVEGWIARWAYKYLHFTHEASVQGYYRAVLRTLLSSAMRRVRPRLKLH
jgi:NADH:quinone reductase (non-electrogenic)